MKSGYLYIISNKAFPGFVKVGITENIENRLRSYQTSDPKRGYKIEFYIKHPNCREAEKRIKKMMKYFSTDIIQKGEWYKCNLQVAIDRLTEQVDDYESGEWTSQI
jgi:predicted GIY-YIG superfamily endonuclease